MRKNKGITLIVLIISIIVMLILIGTTVTIMIKTGLLNFAEKSASVQKIAKVEEDINLILEDIFINNLGKPTDQTELIAKLKDKGYNIKSFSSSPEELRGLIIQDTTGDESIDELNIVQGASKTIKVLLDVEETESKRYIEIENKFYLITINNTKATISRNPKEEVSGGEYKLKVTPISGGPTLKTGETQITEEISIVNGTELTVDAGQITGDNFELIIHEETTNITKRVKVKVLSNPQYATTLSLSSEKTEVEPGKTIKITAKINEGSTDTISWRIEPTSAGTINNQGELTVNSNVSAETIIKVFAKCVRADGTTTTVPEQSLQIKVAESGPISDVVDNTARTTTKDWGTNWELLSSMADEIAKSNKVTNETTELKVKINGTTQTIGIGDTATVSVQATTDSYAAITAGTYKVRILGFNHDTLSNGSKAGISFEFINIIGKTKMVDTSGSTANTGGWGNRALKNTLNNTVRNKLSNSKYIKSVKKDYTKATNSNITNNYDYLWLLSSWELLGKQEGNDTTNGTRYVFYKMNPSANTRVKKNNSGTTSIWWLRSTPTTQNNIFVYVSTFGSSGATAYGDNRNACGFAPGFAI